MSTLTNIPINARSMTGIITLSDGIATISEGQISTTGDIEAGDISGNNITANSLTTGDLTLNGSLEVPLVNDISVSTIGGSELVSLYNKGETYLEQDTHMNRAYSYSTPTTGYEVANKSYVDSKVPIYAQITTITVLPFINFPTLIELVYPASPPPSYYVSLPDARYIPIGTQLTFFSRGVPPLSSRLGIKGRTVNQVIQNAYGVVNQFVYFEPYMNAMTFVCISNTLSTTEPMYMVIEFNYDFREVFVNHSTTSNPSQDNYMVNTWHNFNTFQNDAGGVALQIALGSDFQLLGEMSVDGLNVTPVELSYLSGVTSPIQSQLDLCVSTSGNNAFTGINTFQNQVILDTSGNFNITTLPLNVDISNQYFQTPVRANGTGTFVTTLIGWTFSGLSGTSRLVHCRGGTVYNSSRGIFPIAGQSQYLAYYFNGGSASITVSQNITFTETGDYLLTYYALGNVGSYSGATESLISSIAGTTQTAILTESVWCLQKMRFRVTSIVSPIQLSFIGSTTTTGNRIFDLYGIEIHKCIGVNVSDGGITNHQLLEYNGINTTNIFNSGNTINYGRTLLFGGLELYNRFAPSTTLLCDSIYGSSSTSTGGRVIAIGNASALNGVHLLDVMAIGVEACQNVGPVSFNQSYAGANNGIIAIGYRALREFNGFLSTGSSSLQNYFIGHDAGRLLTIPTGSHRYNIAMGYQVLNGRAASTNIQYNALYGHNIMSTATGATSTIQGNSVFGNESFLIARGANNTSVGYNNFNLATNTATNNNCFFGQSVCNTQAGASNVMTNCTFIGSNTDVTIASNYSNSTCLGYNSRIEFSNGIFLGTINEMTYAKGGLNLPVTTNLELNGNILANLTTITPIQLSFLNQVTANKLPSLAIEDMGTRSPSLASACSFFGNLAGNTQITTTTTGVHNSGFGTGTLKDNDAGSYNTAAGSKAGFSHDTGDYCTYVGYFAGGANTASNVTIVGANSCTTQTSIANATVIGQANSVADGNTNAIILGQGNTISGNNCGIIGYGITNNTANRIHIGNATQTVYIQNDLIVNDVLQTIGELQPASILHKKYYASAVNPTVLTAVTMSAPLYEYNRVNITVGTFSLPLSSEVEIGTVLRFRRITTLTGAVTVQIQTGSGQSILARNSISTVTSTVLMVTGITYSSIIYLDTNLWAVMD